MYIIVSTEASWLELEKLSLLPNLSLGSILEWLALVLFLAVEDRAPDYPSARESLVTISR